MKIRESDKFDATLILTVEEVRILARAIDETLRGLAERELGSRMGASKSEVESVMNSLQVLLGQMKRMG
jgi:hypothetical protein